MNHPLKNKKSCLQKSKEDPKSKYWLKKSDAAWGALIHSIFGTCAVNNRGCQGRLEAHHLINRSIKATRHSRENGIILCSLHHKFSRYLSPHKAPLEFAEWLQNKYPEKWSWVQEHKNDWKTATLDYKVAYENLTMLLAQQLKSYGE